MNDIIAYKENVNQKHTVQCFLQHAKPDGCTTPAETGLRALACGRYRFLAKWNWKESPPRSQCYGFGALITKVASLLGTN